MDPNLVTAEVTRVGGNLGTGDSVRTRLHSTLSIVCLEIMNAQCVRFIIFLSWSSDRGIFEVYGNLTCHDRYKIDVRVFNISIEDSPFEFVVTLGALLF